MIEEKGKSASLSSGLAAIKGFDSVEDVELHGGGSADQEAQNTYKVYPTSNASPEEIIEEIENHVSKGYVLLPSPTGGDFVYVTVKTS